MDRRKFIEVGAALATLAAAEIVRAGGGTTPSTGGTGFLGRPIASRFAFGYHNGERNGYWIDAMSRPYETAPARVNVFMLGVISSSYPNGSNPLRRMEIDLNYKLAGTIVAPYRWATLTRVDGLGTSKPISHELRSD